MLLDILYEDIAAILGTSAYATLHSIMGGVGRTVDGDLIHSINEGLVELLSLGGEVP